MDWPHAFLLLYVLAVICPSDAVFWGDDDDENDVGILAPKDYDYDSSRFDYWPEEYYDSFPIEYVRYNEGDVPEGAASLAFVFDVTGSMYDDLVQVIEGAAKILATTLARRDKPLYNYVLVPFHDPG